MSYLEMKGVGRQGPTLGVNLLEVALAGMPRGPMVCVEWHKESRQRCVLSLAAASSRSTTVSQSAEATVRVST